VGRPRHRRGVRGGAAYRLTSPAAFRQAATSGCLTRTRCSWYRITSYADDERAHCADEASAASAGIASATGNRATNTSALIVRRRKMRPSFGRGTRRARPGTARRRRTARTRGTVSSSSPTPPRVVFRPRAKRTVPATIDRLAERDQDDQPVPLGEVLRRDAPAAAHADHDRAEVVDRTRHEPHCDAHSPIEEAGNHEQRRADDRSGREPDECVPAFGIVASDDGGEDEMKKADEEVRDTEEHGVVSEGARAPPGRRRTSRPSRRASRAELRPRRHPSRSSTMRTRSTSTRAPRARASRGRPHATSDRSRGSSSPA
jgi:hypothetical protein